MRQIVQVTNPALAGNSTVPISPMSDYTCLLMAIAICTLWCAGDMGVPVLDTVGWGFGSPYLDWGV